ncbi:hypothetical protein Hanom_Chr17g01554861 [Helianthus anomalus]
MPLQYRFIQPTLIMLTELGSGLSIEMEHADLSRGRGVNNGFVSKNRFLPQTAITHEPVSPKPVWAQPRLGGVV